MIKYSQEVVKAAEELIKEHKSYSEAHLEAADDYYRYDAEEERTNSIKAAIVSCEFAIRMGGVGKALQNGHLWTKEIKSYLEELL